MRRSWYPRFLAALTTATLWSFAAGAAAPSPAPPSAASTLAKVVAAFGGTAVLDSIKTRVVVTKLGMPEGTITTTVQSPNRFLQHLEIPAYHLDTTTAFDGTAGWTRDAYGNVKAATGDLLTTLQCESVSANDASMRHGVWPTTVAAKPSQVLDGKSYLVLSVNPKGCPSSTLFVDPKTYLVGRVDASGQSVSFSNYVKGPLGEEYAKTEVVTGPMGTVIATVDSVADNVTLDPSLFVMPPQPSPSPSASGAPATPSPAPAPSATMSP